MYRLGAFNVRYAWQSFAKPADLSNATNLRRPLFLATKAEFETIAGPNIERLKTCVY